MLTKLWSENLKGRDHLGDIKEIGFRNGFNWLRIESSNKPSRFIKGGKFLDRMSDNQLLKRNCAPWS